MCIYILIVNENLLHAPNTHIRAVRIYMCTPFYVRIVYSYSKASFKVSFGGNHIRNLLVRIFTVKKKNFN